LLDDTDEHLSAKFKKFDLIGVPYQIILGSKSTGDKFEFKEVNGKTETLSIDEIKNKLMNKIKEDMKVIGKVELDPKFDGKQMIMVIQPL